jgi:release factor glutamine methyltransferase
VIPSTVAEALALARQRGVDRLDAQLLLARALGRPRAWLLAHDDAPIDDEPARRFDAELARRAAGEPLAYIVGQKEFHGLVLQVDAGVLVPRPDTETLVGWALELLQGELASVPAPRVLDLGTGSGAIALAVKHDCRRAELAAVDASEAALAVASGNGRRLGLQVEWLRGDWWQPLSGRRFDLVLSNPPYIAEGDPHLAALAHEPAMALSSGADGLAAIRHIVAQAREHLAPGRWLLLEHGHEQAGAVRDLLRDAGLVDACSRPDLAGVMRCSGARNG